MIVGAIALSIVGAIAPSIVSAIAFSVVGAIAFRLSVQPILVVGAPSRLHDRTDVLVHRTDDRPLHRVDPVIAPTTLANRTVGDLGERALIRRITARLDTPSWVVVGAGDDAAIVEPERGTLDVLTTDVQVEGVHFDRRYMPADAIGHRALAVNLSDLAAMGARPRAVLLSLVLPESLDVAVVDGLLDGMLPLARAHGAAIVGGNIARSPGPMLVDVTAIGSVRPRRALTRSAARPGDHVYVTGTIGDALVGLKSLQRGDGRRSDASSGNSAQERQEQRFLRPEPRVRAGMLLGRTRTASACMDLSDGLADGIRQIAEASRVGIALDADALPIVEAVRRWHNDRGEDAIAAVLAGGEDYELLFTVKPAHGGRLRAVLKTLGNLRVTKVGVVTKDPKLVVKTTDGARELPEGFDHFTSCDE